MSNPDERRSRLERFNDLSFGELRKFIDETLERSSGAVSDADFFPSSKQDFIDLWKILDEKIHPPRKEVPSDAPPPPVYEGPPYVPYWVFEPSDELDSMHERLDRLEDQRDEAIAASSSGRYISFLEDQMGELERQIDGRTSEERREHRESAAEYEDAWAAHQERVREWRVQTGQEQPRSLGTPLKERIVKRFRREIEREFGPGDGVPTEELRWRLLPPGELSEEHVRRYYVGLQNKNRGAQYDPDRIVKALSLDPKQRYEEIGEVEGYTVFTFSYTSSVLLECPIVGNAIYVIHKDWERWSKMSKQELMADESGEVVRIQHRGDWFEQLKKELGTPSSPASETPV